MNILHNFDYYLQVLRNCINYIFENKISEARKSIHAVFRALKNQNAKLVLCQELSQHVSGKLKKGLSKTKAIYNTKTFDTFLCFILGNNAILETPQFDLIVKLMHYALQVSFLYLTKQLRSYFMYN